MSGSRIALAAARAAALRPSAAVLAAVACLRFWKRSSRFAWESGMMPRAMGCVRFLVFLYCLSLKMRDLRGKWVAPAKAGKLPARRAAAFRLVTRSFRGPAGSIQFGPGRLRGGAGVLEMAAGKFPFAARMLQAPVGRLPMATESFRIGKGR